MPYTHVVASSNLAGPTKYDAGKVKSYHGLNWVRIPIASLAKGRAKRVLPNRRMVEGHKQDSVCSVMCENAPVKLVRLMEIGAD